MKTLCEFLEWYAKLGGRTYQIDISELYRTKFYDYD